MAAPTATTACTRPALARDRLNTPALLLDLDAFEANVTRMAAIVGKAGGSIRPHAKTHKCSRIARRQIAAGAVGICCATLDEAEVMAEQGIGGLLITSPLTTETKLQRLIDLVRSAPDTTVVVDNPAIARIIGALANSAGVVVSVLVDLDIGFGRTGVADADGVVLLAQEILRLPALRAVGIQAYGGHLQHIRDFDERARACRLAYRSIRAAIAALTALGMPPRIVTGGGTGTHRIDLDAGIFTEIQAGSYIFMDNDYLPVEQPQGNFAPALFVQTAVISANRAGTVTTDGGTKAFAQNGPPPTIVRPPNLDASYRCAGDEHGEITFAPDSQRFSLGEHLECITPHCDPTVVLYDTFHCVRGEAVVEIWDIDARGRR